MASIGTGTFLGCTSLTAVTVPGNVTSLGYQAFGGCTALTGVFFLGNAPTTVDADVFLGSPNVKAYYCSPATGWGATLSDAPTVAVSAPLIVRPPADQSVRAGSKVTFSVSAFGPPSLRYQWQFNGTNISGAKSSTLTLNSVQSKNAGTYTVVVANSYGTTNSPPAVLTIAGAAGTYKGLITTGSAFDAANSGAFVLTVTPGGAFSAKLSFPTETISASGGLAWDGGPAGAAARFTSQVGGRKVEVRLRLASDSSTTVSGSLTAVGESEPAAQLDGAMVANTTSAGPFHLTLLPATTNQPAGNGSGSVAVSTNGVQINLRLADGTALVALASDRLQNGVIPVFSPLYGQKGFLIGWLSLTNDQVVSASALAWHKAAGPSTGAATEGFNQWIWVQGDASIPGTNAVHGVAGQPGSTP